LNSIVENKIKLYPDPVQTKFQQLRSMLIDVAEENQVESIEETLKWGEPAYLAKGGSTIRIDWKPKAPDSMFVFFDCKTILVETFKEVFFDIFTFQGNRAIILRLDKPLPEELQTCFLMALKYHKLKNLPLLGA